MNKARSHKQAVDAAYEAIKRLQESGEEVTPTSVSREAGIARGNLYLRTNRLNNDWQKVIELIQSLKAPMCKEAPIISPVLAEFSLLRQKQAKLAKVCERMEHAANKTFRELLDSYLYYWKKDKNSVTDKTRMAELLEEVNHNRRTIRELEAALRKAVAESEADEQPSNSRVVGLARKQIISPDHYLADKNGEYLYSSQRAHEAWNHAVMELDDALREKKPAAIYLLCGPQGSGKSTWAALHKANQLGLNLYFDGTMKTVADRAAIVVRAKKYGVRIICVRLLVTLEQCLRNNASVGRGKKIPEDVVRATFRDFDEVIVDEGFDEIHMIRERANHAY